MKKYSFIDMTGTETILKFASKQEAQKYASNNNIYKWYTLHDDFCPWWSLADCDCGASFRS